MEKYINFYNRKYALIIKQLLIKIMVSKNVWFNL